MCVEVESKHTKGKLLLDNKKGVQRCRKKGGKRERGKAARVTHRKGKQQQLD